MSKYVFDPKRPGAYFGLNANSSDFGRVQRVKRGDVVELSDDMAQKVRDEFGPHCLRPEGSVVVGVGAGAVARSEHDALRQERDFWRLSAMANARSAADRKSMAIAAGAASNADADAQRAALLSVPESGLPDVLDAMRIVAKGWA